MERNPATAAAATNNFGYYKDSINYLSPNSTYSDIYQLTYPFEDDIKEKRYQMPAAPGPTSYQQQQVQPTTHQQTQPPPQTIPNVQYHQNYPKTVDYHQQAYKSSDKAQSMINPYSNYNYPNYKDGSQYTTTANYYDQYKYNVGLATTPPSNYGKTAKDTNYHQNFSPGTYVDSKLGTVTYCDEINHAAKASVAKSANTAQVSQFPMYPNCYGYPTATTYPNQNYCSYGQSCNEDARVLWDEYQNRRLVSSYVSTGAGASPAAVQNPNAPPQANCRLKPNYNPEYYGSSAAYHAYHTAEGMRAREKIIYSMNSHVPAENLYNSRSRCLPVDYKYHQAVQQNVMMTPYDHRYNYVASDAQTFDYYSQRQDAGATYHHPAYGKPSIVAAAAAQKHIRSSAVVSNEFCGSQPYYVCNDQLAPAEYQDAYTQQYLRGDARSMVYNMGMMAANRNVPPPTNDIMSKEVFHAQPTLDGTYYTNVVNNQGHLMQNLIGSEKTKTSPSKGQNLREFLASWNEDEDDGVEKMEEHENQVYLQQTNIEVENSATENHLQFKGSFNTRPKIHVGITVDSNVASNQYINLPDIIIDIEKPKDTDLISHSIGSTQSVGGGNTEKLVVLESVDIPVSDLSYANINLLDGFDAVQDASTIVPIPDQIVGECGVVEDVVKDMTIQMLNGDGVVEKMNNVADDLLRVEETTVNRNDDLVGSVKSISKEKRKRRLTRPKITERTKVKCKPVERIITTRSGKVFRVKKVMKDMKKRRNKTLKKTMLLERHSKEETKDTIHSLINPKTLKDICIGFFNSPAGRDMLLERNSCDIEQKEDIVEIGEDKEQSDQQLQQHPSSSIIPKLSALCEYALNSFYEEKNILLLNLDDVDSNLYFIECDINENVVSTNETNLNENDFIEVYIDDEMDEGDKTNNPSTVTTTSTNYENDSSTVEMITNGVGDAADDEANDSFNDKHNVVNSSTNDDHLDINFLTEFCLQSDENSRDFSALHHEEIVPDNIHAFESEKLLKYLQHKYIQKSNYLKIFVIDKICKRYRKFILRSRKNNRRHQQQQHLKNNGTSDKMLLSKFKQKFRVKQSENSN